MLHFKKNTETKWIDILIAFHIFSRIIFGFFARARFNAAKTQFAYCFFSNVPWKPSFLGHIHLALRSIFYNEAVFLWVCHSVNVLAFLETTTSLFSIPTSLTLGNNIFIFSDCLYKPVKSSNEPLQNMIIYMNILISSNTFDDFLLD